MHRNAAVLEGVLEKFDVVVVVVGVGEEIVFAREHVGGTHVHLGQFGFLRVLDREKELLIVVAEVAALLVAQVGRRFAVTDDFDGAIDIHRAVVARNHHLDFVLRELFEQLQQGRMLKPTA